MLLSHWQFVLGSLPYWKMKLLTVRHLPCMTTPPTEMQHQTMTEPPLSFTDGCKPSLSYLSLITEPEISNLDLALHQTCCHWFSVQFLLSLFLLVFLPYLRLRPFLMRLHWTTDDSAEGQMHFTGPVLGFFIIFFNFYLSNFLTFVFVFWIHCTPHQDMPSCQLTSR